MLFASAASSPDRPAVVDGNETTSHGELAGAAARVAATLVETGTRPGDRVAILMRRGADAAGAFFGALAAGAAAVMVNELLRPRQIDHILGHSGASTLIASAELTDRFDRPLESDARLIQPSSLPGSETAAPVRRDDDDLAQIIYTSGSTGLPKGVMISHGNLWAGMRAVTDYLEISSEDRIASLLPFNFDYGLNQLLCAIGAEATLVVERSPIAARIVGTVREQEVSMLAAVPPLWLQLLTVDDFRDSPLPALGVMTNSGGRLPPSAVKALTAAQPGADLFLMYGLTEAFRSTYLRPELVERKPTSIGQAIPGAEILVVDGELRRCAPGEVGELVHRGPTVAMGYWQDSEATARVYRPDPEDRSSRPVVFSGDLVHSDDDGDLFFVGRDDAMIKTLGYRVSPDEVVDVLHASGEIVEAVVAPEPDDLRGQAIVAYVVLKQRGRLDRLEQFVGAELPRYMQPSRIEVRRELPRTASGKHDPRATARRASDRA